MKLTTSVAQSRGHKWEQATIKLEPDQKDELRACSFTLTIWDDGDLYLSYDEVEDLAKGAILIGSLDIKDIQAAERPRVALFQHLAKEIV